LWILNEFLEVFRLNGFYIFPLELSLQILRESFSISTFATNISAIIFRFNFRHKYFGNHFPLQLSPQTFRQSFSVSTFSTNISAIIFHSNFRYKHLFLNIFYLKKNMNLRRFFFDIILLNVLRLWNGGEIVNDKFSA
jgi:hypothetical protein